MKYADVAERLRAIVGEENAAEIEEARLRLLKWEADPLTAYTDGFLEGQRSGDRQGRYMALWRLLAKRFESLPEDVVERLKQAEVRDLDRWLDRMLTAPTLADVLTDATDE
jgi:hypothetical protein